MQAQTLRMAAPAGIDRHDDEGQRRAFASDSDTREGHIPQTILKPRSTEDVTAIVRWANDTGIGIVPVSSSGRRRRGDTVPARDNTAIVDLSGMQRLIHSDARDKIAIIEPGVDFGIVDRLLLPHGLRAFRPLAPRAGKSVIASYLEREPLIAANDHWDVGDPFGGTAVVLGNGRYAPTGSAAIEGTLAEQLARGHRQMVPVGPINLDILRVLQGAQGSLGIMTWAAIYLERIPVLETAWFATSDALDPVIDLTCDLLHGRLGNALFIVDRVQLALLLGRNASELEVLARKLPAWTLFVSLSAGREQPEAKMAWQTADLQRCAGQHGVELTVAVAGHAAAALSGQLHSSEPVSFRDRALGAHRELFFLQQLNRASGFVTLVRGTMADASLASLPVGVYIQPMTQGVNCHIEFTLPYGPEDSRQAAIAADAWQLAARRCAEQGGFFSRPYGRWADFAYARDTGARPMLSMTKSIFDPRGVMNPGHLPY